MLAVEAVRLRKEFTRRRRPPVLALDDVSFTVARGECVAVLGQNGSGKSTLVRLLSRCCCSTAAARGCSGTTRTRRRPRDPAPGHRARRRGRAQRPPRQALWLVGAGLLRLDGRQHAHDRLHRRGRGGDRRAARRRAPDDDPADRRGDLGLPRDRVRDPHQTVAWERWEGTIEYTFMASLSRAVHLLGMGAFAVLYGVLRTAALFAVVALFFGLSFPDANFLAALVLLAVASISFVGVGMVTAVLPLISPEKGAQRGFIAQGLPLVVSGVYYPVEVMPGWMESIAALSPATYALEGIRASVLDGAGLGSEPLPLAVLGVVSIPVGLLVFRAGERYAKRHGKLKRSG